jgi:hypothetical protein
MQFSTYFFSSIISFLGLACGIALIKIAPEEKKPLESYFILISRTIIALSLVFALIYYFGKGYSFFLVALLSALFLIAEIKIRKNSPRHMLEFLLYSILFFLSRENLSLFAIQSSMIFLYGISSASISFEKKNYASVIFGNIIFLAIDNMLYFLPLLSPNL